MSISGELMLHGAVRLKFVGQQSLTTGIYNRSLTMAERRLSGMFEGWEGEEL
jgi:hypothetical protein